MISVERYHDPHDVEMQTFEKDDQPVRLYAKGGKAFYILSNGDDLNAIWSDGKYLIGIWGPMEMSELTSIIDSIGEEHEH